MASEIALLFFKDIDSKGKELDKQNSSKDFYSEILRGLLKVNSIQRGAITCSFKVLPFVANIYEGLHGGAVASIAERVCLACARTVVTEDRPVFLGELAVSFLSSATKMEDVIVEGSVLRSGRNLTVVTCDFRMKDTRKLVYSTRATFYHISPSKL